ncbi:hypothetical protein C8R46DRAFT_1228279 [Mycena filopes]|nr:hypothetical protein C8R46DRAFT_1228279 [Mycena filopes]
MPAFLSRPQLDPEKNVPLRPVLSPFNRVLSWMFPPVSDQNQKGPNDPPHHYRRKGYSEEESRQAAAKLWSIYIGEAERYDKALVESWKADMEGMLIFSGLFSASLTAFLIESYRTLQPDSGDSTVLLLSQISAQLVALSNDTSFVPPAAPNFRPSTSALLCNVLWFLSLTLSLTCALLATLIEQWAREFLHKTEKRPSPIRRARVLSFLYFGLRRFGFHFVVDLIPLLLHISLILFLAGLIAFLSPINHIMMALISASLGIFVTVYATITLLPILNLDSPYRTPFSGLAWDLLHGIHTRFSSAPAATTSNLANTVASAALVDTVERDHRALKWTVESLTDDAEFLPFLEATAEAIHGVKGFHLVNDHLFIPLLNGDSAQRPLGGRVVDFILGCRNLDSKDPLRDRGLITGMKALWALGMISGRTGELFQHAVDLWFQRDYDAAVFAPSHGGDSHLKSLGASSAMAMQYSTINNARNHVAAVVRMAQQKVDRPSFVAAVKKLHHNLHCIGLTDLPEEFYSTQHALRVWTDATSTAEMVEVELLLTLLTKETLWSDIHVSNLCRFLLQAADINFLGGHLPYEFERTCFKILPRVPSTTRNLPVLRRSSDTQYLDPSQYHNSAGQMSNLDAIMASFLRLLPCLTVQHAIPIFTRYLAKRNDDDALDVALKNCDLPYLMDSLAGMLEPAKDNSDILHSLRAVLVRPSYRTTVHRWHERDDIVYDFMASQGIFTDPQFSAVSVVMQVRKLEWLRRCALLELLDLEPLPHARDQIDKALAIRRVLVAHPLLSSAADTSMSSPDMTLQELKLDIRHRVTQSKIVCMTGFILASVKSPGEVASGHTMDTLNQCFPFTSDRVDSGIMVNFAQAWLALVRDLVANPGNSRLNAMFSAWIKYFAALPKIYYNTAAAPLYEEALKLYQGFLQAIGSPPFQLEAVTTALAALTTLSSASI